MGNVPSETGRVRHCGHRDMPPCYRCRSQSGNAILSLPPVTALAGNGASHRDDDARS